MGLKSKDNHVIYQSWAAFCANIPNIILGMSIAWNGAYLPKFITTECPLNEGKLSESQLGMIAGIGAVGCVVGNLLSGWLSEKFGRKNTLVLVGIPQLISWMLLLTNDYLMTIIGRAVLGIVAGFTFVVVPVFVAEISDDEHRGFFGTFLSLACNMGVFLGFVLIKFVDYHTVNAVMALISLCYFGGILSIKESPIWYALKNRKEEAVIANFYYKGKADEMIDGLNISANEVQTFKFQDFYSKDTRKGVILSLIVIIFPLVSGTIVLINYAVRIFDEASTNLSSIVQSMIVALIQVIGSYIATILVERVGRKTLLVVSSAGSFISLAVMGSYYYLKAIHIDVSHVTIIPLLSFSVLVLFSAVGLAGVPFVIIAELVPERMRGPVFTICLVLFSGFATLVMISFMPLVNRIGMHGLIWLYAIFSIIACTITLLFIPETKKKVEQVDTTKA